MMKYELRKVNSVHTYLQYIETGIIYQLIYRKWIHLKRWD